MQCLDKVCILSGVCECVGELQGARYEGMQQMDELMIGGAFGLRCLYTPRKP